MTFREAIKAFNAKYPNRMVGRVYEFKEGFLIMAPQKNSIHKDTTDPTFVMSKDGKDIYQFVISSDLARYKKMIKKMVYDAILNEEE